MKFGKKYRLFTKEDTIEFQDVMVTGRLEFRVRLARLLEAVALQ